MKIVNLLLAVPLVAGAAGAFAATPVQREGRASSIGGVAVATMQSRCAACHVEQLQGRAALNYIVTPRPIARETVHARGTFSDSVAGGN